VIRWITTHEIRIIARVNLIAGPWTVRALEPDRPPLLVLNTRTCLLVELGEPKAPAKTSETINLMSYFVPEVRTQLDANHWLLRSDNINT
jgi:hypothetical protein